MRFLQFIYRTHRLACVASDSKRATSEVYKNDEHDITKLERLLLSVLWYNLINKISFNLQVQVLP